MEEEKKENEAEAKESLDDDFADAKDPEEEAKKAEEEAKRQAEEEERKKDEEEAAAKDKEPDPYPEQPSYEYGDKNLEAMELSRQDFYKGYKKTNTVKLIISIAGLVLIILGWVLPTVLGWGSGTTPMVIALIVAAVVLVALGIESFVSRKSSDKKVNAYFNELYGHLNDYLFEGMDVQGLQGTVDSKITKEEFAKNGMFPSAVSIGSRDNITFSYEGTDFALCDAAAQKDAGKGLSTVFVGKYLRSNNAISGEGEGLLLYFRGNKRALPPKEAMASLPKLERNDTYEIYGDRSFLPYLTEEVKDLLAEIHTNKTLVDVSIAIKPGKTYFALGYEDSLMVLPMQKPYNPGPTREYRDELKLFLAIGQALNKEVAKEEAPVENKEEAPSSEPAKENEEKAA